MIPEAVKRTQPPAVVLVGSENPAKVRATALAVAAVLPGCPVAGVAVRGGVDHQPLGMGVVRRGAIRRAWAAAASRQGAWGVGLENGLIRRGGHLFAVGWCAIAGGRRLLGAASAPEFLLPEALAAAVEDALRSGGTLAEATARAFGGSAAAWAQRGTVYAVTGGAVDRVDLWRSAVALALGSACWKAGLRPGPGDGA